MKDKELLELAATAAGWVYLTNGQLYVDGEGNIDWNPLTDDGDALRLAVKLGIDIRLFHLFARRPPEEMRMDCLVDRIGRGFVEKVGADPYAATRRCIVRAAAEIGQGVVTPNAIVTGAEPVGGASGGRNGSATLEEQQ